MAALHEALTNLSPTEWSDVPQDSLEDYVQKILSAGELICSSVPPPADGTPFSESKPSETKPNTAISHSDMEPSQARSLPAQEEYEELQSSWGKPLKMSSKENPLAVALYKMAGKDRHGGWFARRSIHEGIGYTKFRDAMMNELETSLKVEGGPGAGCIRGIAADKRLEDHELDRSRVQVMQLSAQFPGPTTPRDFVGMLISSESALTEKSVSGGGISASPVPRHFMVISRPINHSDAPERSGHIRGQYESVELIREIPLISTKSKSTPNLLETKEDSKKSAGALKRSKTDMVPGKEADEDDEDKDTPDSERELNPVEWIMVTRSDPGGGIPRFMVDRGTPSTMITDVHKFLDWAAKGQPDTSKKDPAQEDSGALVTDGAAAEQPTSTAPGGILSHITQAFDAYAPTMVSSFVHDRLDHQEPDDSSSEVSEDSFTSADEGPGPGDSTESISITSLKAAAEGDGKRKLDSHEKKLLEIAQKREKLNDKLAKKREEEAAKLKKAQEADDGDATKAQERHDKEIQKQEEKHQKESDKLDQKREREIEKLNQKKKKEFDRDALHKVSRERDEFRSQVDMLKRENAVLRERIDHLEAAKSKTTDV